MGNACINPPIDLNIQNHEGQTILMNRIAGTSNFGPRYSLLEENIINDIEKFGFNNLNLDIIDRNDLSLIHYVVKYNRVKIFKYLLHHGVKLPENIHNHANRPHILMVIIGKNGTLLRQLIKNYLETNNELALDLILGYRIIYPAEFNQIYNSSELQQKFIHKLYAYSTSEISIYKATREELKIMYINCGKTILEISQKEYGNTHTIENIMECIYKKLSKKHKLESKDYLWLLAPITPQNKLYDKITADVNQLPRDEKIEILLTEHHKITKYYHQLNHGD